MTKSKGTKIGILFLAATPFLAVAAPVLAQSYGLGDQVLTLGPMAIRPLDRTVDFSYGNDGYLSGAGYYAAPLLLPDGATIFQMCVYGNIPNDAALVWAMIQSVKLVPGGQNPLYSNIIGSFVQDSIVIGYGTVCTDSLSYVFHDTTGNSDNVAHHVLLYIQGAAGLGGVRIFWRRQISPPPLTPSFTDVPTTSGLFPFVEALKAAGIASGYPDGRFGVNDPITRGQMAVFLSVALGLHWPN